MKAQLHGVWRYLIFVVTGATFIDLKLCNNCSQYPSVALRILPAPQTWECFYDCGLIVSAGSRVVTHIPQTVAAPSSRIRIVSRTPTLWRFLLAATSTTTINPGATTYDPDAVLFSTHRLSAKYVRTSFRRILGGNGWNPKSRTAHYATSNLEFHFVPTT